MKERLDVLLVNKGLSESREKAKRIIMAGLVKVDGTVQDKPGSSFDSDSEIVVEGKLCPYVSRGGLKLEKGIERALEKRPVSTTMVEQLSNDIEDLAIKKGRESREISTSELGELVLEKLYAIDKVAYIRFASVYRHFENLDEFITEVKNIEKRGKNNE